MNKIYFALFAAMLLPVAPIAQTPNWPLDRYLDTAKTILVVKCLSVGPINILMRADVDVQILYVVKGKETLREISVNSQYGMSPGELYLIRTENEATNDGRYFGIDKRDSVVPFGKGEDIELLKTLSPRIVVLRTMNMRVYALESEIRTRTYELEALKNARIEE